MSFFPQYPYINLNDLNLDWLLKHIKDLVQAVGSLDTWREEHEKEYEELKALYDAIISGNFPPAMYDALHDWVVKNAASIMSDVIKMVFFGLENGYFVAYIPDSWSEILFGTSGLDDFPIGYDFGHLTLTY